MSKGWESKSVEEQQNIAAMPKPVVGAGPTIADAERKRRLQELSLQRERILSERTASVHRRSALSSALIDIEEKLSELGWTIHL